MEKRFLKTLPLAVILLAVVGAAGIFLLQKPVSELPIYARVPDFVLTERSGRNVSLSDLAGRPWIADFIFTRCAGQCPMISSGMAVLARELKNARMVSFSVDPDYDTPPILAEYAKNYGADKGWLFLTGDREILNRLTTTLHMNKIDEPMMHSASFVLVDAQGAVRGFYESNDPAAIEKLKQDHACLVHIGGN